MPYIWRSQIGHFNTFQTLKRIIILFPDCFHRGRLRRKWSTRFAKQSGRLYIVHHVVVHVRARVRTYVGVVAAAIDVVAAHHDVDVAPSLASN